MALQPTRAGDLVCMEPLVQRTSGIKAAGAVPVAQRTGVGQCEVKMQARHGDEGVDKVKGKMES